jgi:predicted site-specific integrase-resolvase
MTLGEAAKAVWVSQHTFRRWDPAGKLHTHRDKRNRRMAATEEVVEIEAGPFLITAAVTRLEATATVKARSVMVERDVR